MGVEIRILAEMLDQVTQSDLVLINEPLTSTNPVEAVSICSDLICRFLEKRVTNLTVTHLYDVYFLLRSKLAASQQSMLKSLVTQARYEEDRGMIYSYQLIESEPLGNSYARETAEAFGITPVSYTHLDVYKRQIEAWKTSAVRSIKKEWKY